MSVAVFQTRDLARCFAIREAVFTVEQGIPADDDIDGKDEAAIQLLAIQDGEPVGTARILIAGDTGKIGRIAVLKPHRGNGIGTALVRAAVAALREQPGVARAYLSAQSHTIPFYQALGFTPYGADYDDVGIPHRDMEMRV